MPVIEKYRLVNVRIDAGLTQRKLAEEAGLTVSTVWLAENNRVISYKSARKIVNAFMRRGIHLTMDALDWVVSDTIR